MVYYTLIGCNTEDHLLIRRENVVMETIFILSKAIIHLNIIQIYLQ